MFRSWPKWFENHGTGATLITIATSALALALKIIPLLVILNGNVNRIFVHLFLVVFHEAMGPLQEVSIITVSFEFALSSLHLLFARILLNQLRIRNISLPASICI